MSLPTTPRPTRVAFATVLVLAATLLGACAAPAVPPDARVLIFGEQHDQPDHQRQVAGVVRTLAREGRLAAVVIEMAERGRSTAGLPPDADAARVRETLAWANWNWDTYAPVVLAAVRAGVPVLGGNLPRRSMRDSMADGTLDANVTPDVRQVLAVAVREGHCGLLPAAQEPGMVRIQIARDRSMAQTVADAVQAAPDGQRVLLLTGALHAARDRGVPQHLPAAGLPATAGVSVTLFGEALDGLQADRWQPAARQPRPDPCEGLSRQLQRRSAASAPA